MTKKKKKKKKKEEERTAARKIKTKRYILIAKLHTQKKG